jgi:hypothetical protein
VLWAWDADAEYDEAAGEQWLVFQPCKWSRLVQYAWRYDPCELTPQGAPVPPPGTPSLWSTPDGSVIRDEESLPTNDEMDVSGKHTVMLRYT